MLPKEKELSLLEGPLEWKENLLQNCAPKLRSKSPTIARQELNSQGHGCFPMKLKFSNSKFLFFFDCSQCLYEYQRHANMRTGWSLLRLSAAWSNRESLRSLQASTSRSTKPTHGGGVIGAMTRHLLGRSWPFSHMAIACCKLAWQTGPFNWAVRESSSCPQGFESIYRVIWSIF
jgi:hypothetical protein